MKTRKEIRAAARELLGNSLFSRHWLKAGLGLVVFGIATLGFSYILGALLGSVIYFALPEGALFTETSLGVISQIIMMIVPCFFPVSIGVAAYYLLRLNGAERFSLRAAGKRIFSGYWRNVWLEFLRMFYIYAWSLLLIIPGIVKMFSYSMASFVRIDHPEYTANECITASKKMMKGHKWDLFMLGLSFIGWGILSAILSIPTLGFSYLWCMAYFNQSITVFYKEVSSQS